MHRIIQESLEKATKTEDTLKKEVQHKSNTIQEFQKKIKQCDDRQIKLDEQWSKRVAGLQDQIKE